MRLDLLFAHCADLGVAVEWTERVPAGDYCDVTRTVRLNPRRTRNQLTSILAHEVGHVVFGDRCSTPAAERRASEYGAGLVITPAEYAAAEAVVGPHPGALAVELGVTRHLVEAWRRWYERRRPHETSLATSLAAIGPVSRSEPSD